MSQQNEIRNNAHRLTVTLHNLSEDKAAIMRLASILHYMPDQLARDMKDLSKYISMIEKNKTEE